MNVLSHDFKYLDLAKKVLKMGWKKQDRTGTGTTSIFSEQMRFDLSDGTIPLLTTKKMHYNSIIHELVWFLSGQTNIKYLSDNKVRIWNEWSSPEGHLHQIYGAQWRRWENDNWVNSIALVPVKRGVGVDESYRNLNTDEQIPSLICNEGYTDNSYSERPFYYDAVFKLWTDMISYCYNDKYSYNHYVDQQWRRFENFIRDLHSIPYFYKWCQSPEQYTFTKDYYGSDCYSIDTCMFIPNNAHVSVNLVNFKFTVYDSNTGTSIDYLDAHDISKLYNIPFDELMVIIFTTNVINEHISVFAEKSPPGFVYRQLLVVDQVQQVINSLMNTPDDRRMIVNSWNVGNLNNMALPPCHYSFQLYSRPIDHNQRVDLLVDKYPNRYSHGQIEPITSELLDQMNIPARALSCDLTQRSCDIFLGVPFNIAQYSILTHMIAQVTNHLVDEFIWNGKDCHIYDNHIDQINTQLLRKPYESPRIQLNPAINNINDFTFDDIKVIEYTSHDTIKGSVAV